MSEKESNVIVSWKEIARYFGSGVRTTQRWEHDCGLPVHRPKGGLRGTVLAIKSELDEWAASCAIRVREQTSSPQTGSRIAEEVTPKPNLLQ